MNKEQGRDLVRQTFTHAFDKGRFLNFTSNLVNHIDALKASSWNSQYVKDAFKDHVQRYERLGTYTSPAKETVDILAVHLTKESKLERARTSIRNFVADHLKARDEKDAALVAFVSPSETTWRFSYVKMEYATIEKDSGKVGVQARLTPARRFSYLVGEGESCHTAQTRFLNLLQDTETDPKLADIEEAFSVEAVTKEFYTEYRRLFEKINIALEKLVSDDRTIREEFKAKGVSRVDFAKKLMGQVVFLYFLQKKGWLGVAKENDWGSGSRDFLRRLAKGEYGTYDNLFNDILEPLFYDTLATDRGHEAWCSRFKCRIPFLNGGLFEPLGNYDWLKTDIILPNKLFTNSEFIEEGITGTGVLDVFDRYNFTVNEAEPLEKEVAIDPEMLGMVFENLIEENRRKGLGAYYTPREIVHYMCQESLINYLDTALNTRPQALVPAEPKQGKLLGQPEPEQTTLQTAAYEQVVPRSDIETFVHLGEQYSFYEAAKQSGTIGREYPKPPKSIESNARQIDDKLAEITVCDPAVGSGAFPVGMMTEIVRARCALTPYFNDVRERTPYYFKRQAIQNCLYGVDIDGGAVEIAKLRLWLSLVVDEENAKQIKPLPNLDYKIVAGNSLIRFPFKSHKLQEVEILKGEFFDVTDHEKKAKLKALIDQKLKECFQASKKALGYEVSFDFETVFSEAFHRKSYFDVVIGNPPYVSALKDSRNPDDLRASYRKQYPLLKGAFDLYVVFLLLGDALTGASGTYSWIVPNKLLVADYAKDIVVFLTHRGLHASIDVSTYEVFEGSAVYPVVIIGNKVSCFGTLTRYMTSKLDDLRTGSLEIRETNGFQEYKTFKQTGIQMSSGATGFQAQQLAECLSETHKKNSIPFVVSGCINRYSVDFSDVRYMGKTYRHAFLTQADGIASSKWSFWMREKIVIAGMTKTIEAAYMPKPLALGVGVYAVHGYGSFSPKFLLGVLNSKFLTYFLQQKFVDKHLAGGYLAINKSTLEQLPLVDVPPARQQTIITLVNRILAVKEREPEADTSALESEIDRHVYALYGLTKEEIAIVEGSQGEKFTTTR